MNDNICGLIQVSNYRVLSSNEEKELLNYLKSLPELEAYEIIKNMIEYKSFITLGIIKKVLHKKYYVTKLFEYGLLSSNAQSIKLWLDFGIPKLGFKSVLRIIEKLNNETNRLIEKSVYWLPLFIDNDDIKSQNLLDNLKEKQKADRQLNLYVDGEIVSTNSEHPYQQLSN